MDGMARGRFCLPQPPTQVRGKGMNMSPGPSCLEFADMQEGIPVTKVVKRDPKTNFFKLYVKSIPNNFDQDMLYNLFAAYGEPQHSYVSPIRPNFPLKYGFISYATYEECENAIIGINGNQLAFGIVVEFAKEKSEVDYFPELVRSSIGDSSCTRNSAADASTLEWVLKGERVDPRQIKLTVENSPSPDARRVKMTVDPNLPLTVNLPVTDQCKIPQRSAEDLKIIEHFLFQKVVDIDSKLPTENKCLVCQAAAYGGCENCCAFYCSQECLTRDWPKHANECITNRNSSLASGGGGDSSDLNRSRDNLTNGFSNSPRGEDRQSGGFNNRRSTGGQDRNSFDNRSDTSQGRNFDNRSHNNHDRSFDSNKSLNQDRNDYCNNRNNHQDRNNRGNNRNDQDRNNYGNNRNNNQDRNNHGNNRNNQDNYGNNRNNQDNYGTNRNNQDNYGTNRNNQDNYGTNRNNQDRNNFGNNRSNGGQDRNSFDNNQDRNRSNFGQDNRNQRRDQGQVQNESNGTMFEMRKARMQSSDNQGQDRRRSDGLQRNRDESERSSQANRRSDSFSSRRSDNSDSQQRSSEGASNARPTVSDVATSNEVLSPGLRFLNQVNLLENASQTSQEKRCDLKFGVVEKVIFSYEESKGVIYVRLAKNDEEYGNLIQMISSDQKLTPYVPVLGGVCAAMYEQMWCRCKVTSLSPLTVFYLDFGNSEQLTPDRLFTLRADNQALNNTPATVFKIKLAEGTPEKYFKLDFGHQFSIKPILQKDGVWVAQVDGVEYTSALAPSNGPSMPVKQPPKYLSVTEFKEASIKIRDGPYITVVPANLLSQLQEMNAKIQSLASCEDAVEPVEMMKCIVRSSADNKWYRARITNLNPLTVKLVDLGVSERTSPNNIRSMPSEYERVNPFAITLCPKEGTPSKYYMENESALFKVLHFNYSNNKWVCDILPVERPSTSAMPANEPASPANIPASPANVPSSSANIPPSPVNVPPSPANVTPSPANIPASPANIPASPANIQSSSSIYPGIFSADKFTTVLITYIEKIDGETLFFVGPKDIFAKINETVPFFNRAHKENLDIKTGAVGLMKFEDMWYRVKVTNCDPLTVYFLDYGNTEPAMPEDIKVCPDTHRDLEPWVHKVKLAAGTNEKYLAVPLYSELSVKPVSVSEDGVVIVHVEGESYTNTSQPERSAPVQEVMTTVAEETTVSVAPTTSTSVPSTSQESDRVPQSEQYPDFLPPDQFSTVHITVCMASDVYYAGGPDVDTAYVDVTTQVNKIQTVERIQPHVGDICLARYSSFWNRAKVESVSPLKVLYIDYGNTDEINAEEICKCPDSFLAIKSPVCKIKLAEGTDRKYFNLGEADKLKAKPLSKLADGTVVVEVEKTTVTEAKPEEVKNQPVETVETKPVETRVEVSQVETQVETRAVEQPSSSTPAGTRAEKEAVKHIVDLLEVGYEAEGVPTKKIDKSLILMLSSSRIPQTLEYANELVFINRMEKEQTDPSFRPKKGELVAVNDSVWSRAQVIAEDKPLVAMIDHGYVLWYNSVKKLPTEFVNIPALAAVFEPDEIPPSQLASFYTTGIFKLTVLKKLENSVQVKTDSGVTGILRPWQYDPLEHGVPLRNGDKVCISRVVNSETLIVYTETLNALVHSLSMECYRNPGKLQRPPQVGDVVIYKDPTSTDGGMFMRTRVTKVDDKQQYDLYNIDEGFTFESQPLEYLFPLPTSFIQEPCQGSKIILKDVGLMEMTDQARAYLALMANEECHFEVKLETDSTVTLIDTKDGHNLNKNLSKLLTPLVVLDPRNDKYTLRSFPPTKPPMDVELMVLVANDKPLYLQLLNMDYFDTIYDDIQLYCAAHTEPYNPCENEICLAKYTDGEFYRCLCVRETNKQISYLQLVDYGNFFAAPTSDIRKVIEDFLKKPVYGLPSKLVGLSKEKESEIVPTLQVNSKHKVIFRSVDDVGNFSVEYVAFDQPPVQ